MIEFLRELLYYFILENKMKKINDLELNQAVIGDAENIEVYCETIVRTMGEEARSLLTLILPIILRINISIVVLDAKDAV